MATLRSPALILRRFPYGETSLVVQAVTRDHGRVHLIAKGAYRPRSRYAWVLDLFDELELEWSHQGGRELQTLQAASILARRLAIALDLRSYRAGLTVLELAGIGAREGQGDPALFALASEALDALAGGARPALLPLAAFELRFLRHLGLAPALERCAACGGEAPAGADGRAAFSISSGGRLCRAHARDARAGGRRVGTLPAALLRRARSLLETEAPPQGLPAEPELAGVRDFVARFLEYHLEGRPKTYRALLSAASRDRPAAGAAS